MSIITKIRTLRLDEYPNLIWVEIETDESLVGLGEAFRGTAAIESIIYNEIGPYLIGEDSKKIEYLSYILKKPYLGFHSSSAEIRAASAVDIALWDLYGHRHNIPIHEALGGAFRNSIQVYNTCAGYSYNNVSNNYNTGSNRRKIKKYEKKRGPYDDQIAFNQNAGELAKSLLDEGYQAMKIWPFDVFAEKTQGNLITHQDLETGLKPFQDIRDAVGNNIEIMCELHSLWSVPAAIEICKELEQYDVFWVEDPLNKMDDEQSISFLRNKIQVPICGSETLAGTTPFRRMLSKNCFDYSMIDLGWCGGLTEGRKIANLSESFNIPITPHDCSSPVVLWAGIHLAFHAPNAMFQEVVRANMATWYKDLVTNLPEIKKGKIELPKEPGLGTNILKNVKERTDVNILEIKKKAN